MLECAANVRQCDFCGQFASEATLTSLKISETETLRFCVYCVSELVSVSPQFTVVVKH